MSSLYGIFFFFARFYRFEVSEVMSKMFPTPTSDADHLKVTDQKSVASSKGTIRFKHY